MPAPRAPLIVISTAFLLVGAIFAYIGGGTLLEQRRYRLQGVRADAVVTDKSLRRATSSAGTAYDITYQFSLADGGRYQQTESVSVTLWERVDRGSPLTVEYVSGAPASARVAGDNSNDSTTAIGALGIGAVLVLGVLIGWVVLLRRGRSRRVADVGASLPGNDAQPEVTEPAGDASSVGIPRDRSFWPLARRSVGVWFGGFFVLLGLPWFVVNGVLPFYADWQFAREGRSTQGMVLTKEIRRTGSTRSETLHYDVTYRFAVAGETIEGRDELTLEDWKRLVEREPADVLYRAQNPSSNRLTGHRPWFMKTFFGLLGLVFAVVGSTMLVRSVRNARLEWHLRQHGVRTRGTVTELSDRNLKLNGAQQWRLQYEYRDPYGHRHVKTVDMPHDEAQRWKVGDAGGVLYDAARPAEAVWIGREATGAFGGSSHT